jgi:ribosomal protein L21E
MIKLFKKFYEEKLGVVYNPKKQCYETLKSKGQKKTMKTA